MPAPRTRLLMVLMMILLVVSACSTSNTIEVGIDSDDASAETSAGSTTVTTAAATTATTAAPAVTTTTSASAVTTTTAGAPATVNRTHFGTFSNWTGGAAGCHIACYFVDVTGDGLADFVAHDNDAVYVLPSTGSSFGPGAAWTVAMSSTSQETASPISSLMTTTPSMSHAQPAAASPTLSPGPTLREAATSLVSWQTLPVMAPPTSSPKTTTVSTSSRPHETEVVGPRD